MTINPLSWLKFRLSHLKQHSWHFKMVRFAFGKKTGDKLSRNAKACPYWWIIVPTSPIVAGLKGLAIGVLYALLWIFLTIGWALRRSVGWFFGRRWPVSYPEFMNSDEYQKRHESYKWNPKPVANRKYGRVQRFAPWELATLVAAVGAVLLWRDALWQIRFWMLYGAIVAGGLWLLGFAIIKWIGPFLKRKYEELCPPIAWVDEDLHSRPGGHVTAGMES